MRAVWRGSYHLNPYIALLLEIYNDQDMFPRRHQRINYPVLFISTFMISYKAAKVPRATESGVLLCAHCVRYLEFYKALRTSNPVWVAQDRTSKVSATNLWNRELQKYFSYNHIPIKKTIAYRNTIFLHFAILFHKNVHTTK